VSEPVTQSPNGFSEVVFIVLDLDIDYIGKIEVVWLFWTAPIVNL
jgi:hypothetical protein